MRTRHSKTLFNAFAGACFSLVMFGSTDARAISIQDLESAIDDTHSLPYSLVKFDKGFQNCDPDSDDVTACADFIAPIAESSGIDKSYVYDAAKIYMDLKHKDYWQLLSDAGKTAACAVAQLISEIPICGIAGDIYEDAKAVYDWFKGLFGGDNSYVPHIGETGHTCLDAGFPYTVKGECSYCPLDQALINGNCGFCPKAIVNYTISADGRCLTKSGKNAEYPAADGGSCVGGGGWGGSPTCCQKPGEQIASSGECYIPSPAIGGPPGNVCKPGQNAASCKCDGHTIDGKCQPCPLKDPNCASSPPPSQFDDSGDGPHSVVPIHRADCGTKRHWNGVKCVPNQPPSCDGYRHWNGSACVPNAETSEPPAPPPASPQLAPPMRVRPAAPAVQTSTLCRFTSGPRSGQIQDYAPMTPIPVGSPCQDARGSSGVVVAR